MFLAAVVQLTCTSDEDANLAQAEALIRRAARYGATLVATPENTNYLGPHGEKVNRALPLDQGPIPRLARLAGELGIHVLVGSVNERSDDPRRCYNTSVLLGPDGGTLGAYRKIHLFDIDVPEATFRESDTTVPGTTPTVVDTPLGALGMSICYDLRFPELYRHLVDRGARLIAIPSAFTLATGKDHWASLLRARAIETQCWVIAPGQYGEHDDAGLRRSWGHSMIVDPWGHIVAMASDGPGLALAEIDLDRVVQVRRGMPLASHRRV